ncbi:shikimate dehydrogenase [Thiococcus pfennigii]|jgi:shikimate dehydrogenase|uniref:shikimate dehydrogenase n=1 Tax=Thiococcus pfennigii TaxID=1057 RepID=UPI0019041EE7|nr:shikimate dehydrogenase [Thiococcus pfennigii]MBK1701065.1 shikimate dehydrogenase [Thiococcus pfennigii]MBK1732345.1 shikimate dehydrogenase [Thiococcus pfennigii]
MPSRYAVIGHPIEHSRSPVIHAAFARQTGQDLVYDRILGRLDDFAGDVQRFFAAGGAGLNVTVPFKEQAWALADERSPYAETAGAVNTLSRLPDGRLRGDNTDGAGLVRDLAGNHGFAFAGRRVLLLGAGGAARGVLRPLLDAGVTELAIANRTAAKAEALAAAAAAFGPVRGGGFDGFAGAGFDLILNATSAGLGGALPALPAGCLSAGGWVYDLVYGPASVPFLDWGRSQGAAVVLDGLGMLVEQAAESFLLWRGVRPETAEVIAELRRAMAR